MEKEEVAIDSHMECYQETRATSSFSIISLQRIQHQMVGQIQSWVRMSTKYFINNFKASEKQMSSFINNCYWFRTISSITYSPSNSLMIIKKMKIQLYHM